MASQTTTSTSPTTRRLTATTSSLLQQIQDDDIVHLRLHDSDTYMINHVYNLIDVLLLDAKKNSSSLETIHFEGEYLGCLRTGDARSKLLQTIGKLPKLREVHINHSLVHVSDITNMLRNNIIIESLSSSSSSASLRTLKLNDLILQGGAEDFAACERAVQLHPTLQVFDVSACTPARLEISLVSLTHAILGRRRHNNIIKQQEDEPHDRSSSGKKTAQSVPPSPAVTAPTTTTTTTTTSHYFSEVVVVCSSPPRPILSSMGTKCMSRVVPEIW